MAPFSPTPILINGYTWYDVTNRTVGGPVYDARDVIKAGGRVPWFVSCYSDDKPSTPLPKNIKEATAAVKKPKEKFWVRNPNDKKKSWKV